MKAKLYWQNCPKIWPWRTTVGVNLEDDFMFMFWKSDDQIKDTLWKFTTFKWTESTEYTKVLKVGYLNEENLGKSLDRLLERKLDQSLKLFTVSSVFWKTLLILRRFKIMRQGNFWQIQSWFFYHKLYMYEIIPNLLKKTKRRWSYSYHTKWGEFLSISASLTFILNLWPHEILLK